jgi:hypothetical protein
MSGTAQDAADEAGRLGRKAEDSQALDVVARIGLVAYGVVHLLLGWLAVQLALGHTGKNASTTGAMHELARQPFGTELVWAVAVGMLLLVVWRAVEAAFGHRDEDGGARLRKRLVSVMKAVLYAVIALSAVKVATGSGSSGGGSKGLTAKVMDWPAGQWLVAAAGLAVLGYGASLVRRGWTEKFAEDLETEGLLGSSGAAYLVLGRVGYIAKGVSIGLVGALLVLAGIDHDSSKSGGLDQALQKVLQAPGGAIAIVVIGLGFACYGLFCFARSRHLDR